MAASPKFSEGSDEPRLTKELDGLLSNRWTLTTDGKGIERSFKFKTFAKTWVRLNPPVTRASSNLQAANITNPGFHDGCFTPVQDQEPPPGVVQCKRKFSLLGQLLFPGQAAETGRDS